MDMETLMAVLASVLLIQTVAMLQTWRQNPEEKGIRDWTLAAAAMTVGVLVTGIGIHLAQSAQPTLSSEFLKTVGSTIGVTGWFLLWVGIRRFQHRSAPERRTVALFIGVTAALLSIKLVADVLPEWRAILSSFAIGTLAGLAAREFVGRSMLRNPVVFLLVAALASTSAIWLLRSVVTLDQLAYRTAYGYVEWLAFYSAIVASVSITTSLVIFTNQRINQQLRAQATRDPLTGVMNRRAFFEFGAPLIAGLDRNTGRLALCLLDLDHFKQVNDTHGHAVGDTVLKAFAKRAGSVLRKGDILARFGGEEFVLLLCNANRTQAAHVLQRLRVAIANLDIRPVGALTFSAGVVTAQGPLPITLDALLEQADRAMYAAKQAGRDRIEYVGPDELAHATSPAARAG